MGGVIKYFFGGIQILALFGCVNFNFGKCSGLMVSMLDSGSSGPGWSCGHSHCVEFLGKILNSTQEHNWAPANMLGQPNRILGGNPEID